MSSGRRSRRLRTVRFDPSAPLLEVEDLQVEFHTRDGVAKAVNGVSYSLAEGETLGDPRRVRLGKSVTAQAIMGILDIPPARIAGGESASGASTCSSMDEDAAPPGPRPARSR